MNKDQNNLQITHNVAEINEEELQNLTISGGRGKGKGKAIWEGVQWVAEKSNDWCPTGACSNSC